MLKEEVNVKTLITQKKDTYEPELHNQELPLNRLLTAFDFSFRGIGAIIGAGVFVLTGIAAATKAGPAIVISYVIAGLLSMFAALAYVNLQPA